MCNYYNYIKACMFNFKKRVMILKNICFIITITFLLFYSCGKEDTNPLDDSDNYITFNPGDNYISCNTDENGEVTIISNSLNAKLTIRCVDKNGNIIKNQEVVYSEYGERSLICTYESDSSYITSFVYGTPSEIISGTGLAKKTSIEKIEKSQFLVTGTVLLVLAVTSIAMAEVNFIFDAYRINTFYLTDFAQNCNREEEGIHHLCKSIRQISELIVDRCKAGFHLGQLAINFAGTSFGSGFSGNTISKLIAEYSVEDAVGKLGEMIIESGIEAYSGKILNLDQVVGIKILFSDESEFAYKFKNLFAGFEIDINDTCCNSVISDTISTEGLVSYYPFNGNANDESGNDNDGTVNGATLTEDRFGNANKAYIFDGNSNYISIPSSESIKLSNSITVTAWVYPTEFGPPAAGGHRLILAKSNWDYYNGGRNYLFAFSSADNPPTSAMFHFSAGTIGGKYSSKTYGLNNWYFIVGTYNKLNDVNKIYVDENLPDTAIDTGDGPITTNDAPLVIGYGGGAAHFSYFHGKIDDIRIYNRVLNDNEIHALFNEGR